MPQLLDLATPVVSRSAGFHHHRGLTLLGEEGQKLMALKSHPPAQVPRSVGERDLENSLCHVDGDSCMVRHDGLLLLLKPAATLALDAD
jgi:hypothetical protein